jgi:hypothetical protein
MENMAVTFRVIKMRWICSENGTYWGGSVARMAHTRNAYGIGVGKISQTATKMLGYWDEISGNGSRGRHVNIIGCAS